MYCSSWMNLLLVASIFSYTAKSTWSFEINNGVHKQISYTTCHQPSCMPFPSKLCTSRLRTRCMSNNNLCTSRHGNDFARNNRNTGYIFYNNPNYKIPSLSSIKQDQDGMKSDNTNAVLSKTVRVITLYAPIWTTLAAFVGFRYNQIISPLLGSLTIMQSSLAFLMLAMGLTITPQDLSYALKQSSVLSTNMFYCFGIMPLIAFMLSKLFAFNNSASAGIILLGSVSGGQASNLFTLLAGGDVALSVVCTFSTTLLGVIATPTLIQLLLGSSIPINCIEVLQSITKLSLLPLMVGLSSGRLLPNVVSRIVPWCPSLGVLATLLLVAGGASNTSGSLAGTKLSLIAASCILPLVGGGLALLFTRDNNKISEKSRRALVIEIISKSPTLAYVLARKHFDSQSTVIPAASMVSLAIIGALVASSWSSIIPLPKSHDDNKD